MKCKLLGHFWISALLLSIISHTQGQVHDKVEQDYQVQGVASSDTHDAPESEADLPPTLKNAIILNKQSKR